MGGGRSIHCTETCLNSSLRPGCCKKRDARSRRAIRCSPCCICPRHPARHRSRYPSRPPASVNHLDAAAAAAAAAQATAPPSLAWPAAFVVPAPPPPATPSAPAGGPEQHPLRFRRG